jgi:glycosyltransferase involved in cell wall biosynthesis
MNILASSYTLDLAGVPTFTLTMYKELVKRHHNITIYSPMGGKLETEMNVIKDVKDIKTPDVIIAQHTNCAVDLKRAFPKIPLVFYSHGLLPEIEQPPPFPADLYFAINEEVKGNFINKGVPEDKIRMVRDFIDTERFTSQKPLHKKLERVLFISNYKKWKNFKTVAGACQKLGVLLKCCGAPYGRCYEIENAINDADLVISWGRGILEAMASGRAALSFDRYEGDGYIDGKTYFEARRDNFSGRVYKYPFTPESLATEMQKYDPGCGTPNRNLILKYHNAVTGVDEILRYLKEIIR